MLIINENKTPTGTVMVSIDIIYIVVKYLVDNSVSFYFEPYPSERYMLQVNKDALGHLKRFIQDIS